MACSLDEGSGHRRNDDLQQHERDGSSDDRCVVYFPQWREIGLEANRRLMC